MSDSASITAKLKQVRRRLFLALFVNASSLAVCGLVMVFALLNLWPLFSFPPPRSTAVLLLSLALISAMLAAFLRMPTCKETARLVDRRAGLQQRLETAWECINPSSEIEVLLVRDANERLFHIRPAAVAPVRLARMTRVILNIGMISICALALVRFLSGWNRQVLGIWGRTADLAAPAEEQGSQGKEVLRRTATETKGRIPGRSSASSSPDSTDSSRIAQEVKQGLQPGSPVTASEPGETAAIDKVPPGDEAAQLPAALKPGPTASSTAPFAGIDEKLASGASGASRSAVSPQGISDSSSKLLPAGSGAASIRAMAGRGNAPSAGAAEAPGTQADGGRGVAVGDSVGSPGTRVLSKGDADFLARHAGDYQNYWLAAQGAITREKIPPGFKKYIADYFAAIHR